jgi:excisionase family DNA binding protein
MVGEQELFSVKEVAAKLGVSKDTIWRRLRMGELPHHKIGRSVRIRWTDVEDYLKRIRK